MRQLLHHGKRGITVQQVAVNGFGRGQACRKRFRRIVRIAVMDHDMPARGAEAPGYDGADAPGGAGNEDGGTHPISQAQRRPIA